MNKILCIILFTFIYFNIHAGSPHPVNKPTPSWYTVKLYAVATITINTKKASIPKAVENYTDGMYYEYSGNGVTITARVKGSAVRFIETVAPTYTNQFTVLSIYPEPTPTVTRTP